MIVREAYRDRTLELCRQHYNGELPAPAGSPPLGPVLSAQSLLPCDWCARAGGAELSASETLEIQARLAAHAVEPLK